MAEPYTHAIWRVKPGRADEFIAAWGELAEWARMHSPGILWGVLLRDVDDPDVFVSTGAWQDAEDIQAFSESPELRRRTEELLQLVDRFEPRRMELSAVRDPAEWADRPFGS